MREQISVEAIIAAFDQTNADPEPRLKHNVTYVRTYVSSYRVMIPPPIADCRLQEHPWSPFAIVLISRRATNASDNDARFILPSSDL